MSKVWVIQHTECENLGTIADALEPKGVSPQYVRTFQGESVPDSMDDVQGLIVMGGPMSVYEQPLYPFLRDEMRLMEQALGEGKPVLGVCLGSQLLASVLGGAVAKGRRKEIGWHQVSLLESAAGDPLWAGVETPFMAYHWHGDVFETPEGATSLARSDLTESQAFRYGSNAYGVLFHMEVTEAMVRDMVAEFRGELLEAGISGRDIVESAGDYLPDLQRIGRPVFEKWASLVKDS